MAFRPGPALRPAACGAAGALAASLLAAVVLALPVDSAAHGSCTGARMRNAGNRCLAIARCYIRQAQGKQDHDSCVAAQLEKTQRNFHDTLIYPDCHPYGDPPDIIAAFDNGMANVATMLQLAGDDRCSRNKMNAAGRLCLHLMAYCEAPAEVEDVPVDPMCVSDEYALMSQLFDKAETRDTCATVDDDPNVQSAVQDAVDAAVYEFDNP
jgi:hypothetical protein